MNIRSERTTMICLKVFFVSLLIAVGEGVNTSTTNSDGHNLKLSEYNEDELHGCYHHNSTLNLCFDIGSDFMKLSSTNGGVLVSLDIRGGPASLIQILDGQFIHGLPSSLIAQLRGHAEGTSDELLVVDLQSENTEYQQQFLKAKLSELSETPEMLLLERLSASLGRQKHQIEALTRFHFTSYALLNGLGIQLPPEFRAVPDLRKLHSRNKRCSDLRTEPNAEKAECLGMCGPGCSCWSWVCGDCCLQNACLQHDKCCNAGGMTSARCLLPFLYGFSCSAGYGGYPACLG